MFLHREQAAPPLLRSQPRLPLLVSGEKSKLLACRAQRQLAHYLQLFCPRAHLTPRTPASSLLPTPSPAHPESPSSTLSLSQACSSDPQNQANPPVMVL